MPKSRRSDRSNRNSFSSISSLVIEADTALIGVWTVARATRIFSEQSTIKALSGIRSFESVSPVFAREASRYSVWPGKVKVGLWMLCLSIGAVTSTSMAPRRRSVTALSRAARAAAPAVSDALPGSMRVSSPTTFMMQNCPSRASSAFSICVSCTGASSMALR